MKSKIAIILLTGLILSSCTDSNTVKQEDYDQVNQNLTDTTQKDTKSFKDAEIDKNTNYEATQAPEEVDVLSGSWDTATNTDFSITGTTNTQTWTDIK